MTVLPTARQELCTVNPLVNCFTGDHFEHVRSHLAVGETVTLLHPPLPLAGVSIRMERGCQQNDSLADG